MSISPKKIEIPDPNVRNLPDKVKQMANEGSKEAVVPGDKMCLIGTTALHVEGDVENTTQLSKNLNTHIAQNRVYYLPKIEADFPLTVIIGTNGLSKVFENCIFLQLTLFLG